MLTALFRALVAHLAPLEIPVYEKGCVPAETGWPFLSLTLSPAMTGMDGALEVTVWCSGDDAHAQRLQLADAVYARFPPDGQAFFTEEGTALVFRKGGQALRFQRDGDVLGVTLPFTLTLYPAE